MNAKQASTPIPLAPEEMDEASRLFGGSLFAALQLAREQELRKHRMSSGRSPGDDGRTLRIPIPAGLMPSQKLGALIPEAYQGLAAGKEGDVEAIPAEGAIPHAKRNLAKYLLGYAGTAAGSAMGALRAQKNKGSLLKGTGKGALLGTLGGTALGALLDKSREQGSIEEMLGDHSRRNELKQRVLGEMMQTGELDQLMGTKQAFYDEEETPEPGVFARAFKMQSKPLKMLVGGQTGFRDAKKDYYMQQKEQINKELMHAQKEYIDLLSKIKTGSDETETPCVDAFCNGIAHMAAMGKKAFDQGMDISDGSVQRLMGDVLSTAKKPFQPAIDTAATGLLGTGAGTAYLTYLLRKRMREQPDKYTEEELPARVELQPYA